MDLCLEVSDLLNGHEWRKVVCVVENKLEFRQYIFVVRTYKLDRNEGKSFLRRGQAKVLFFCAISLVEKIFGTFLACSSMDWPSISNREAY
jgi:hypothetical protein